MSIDLDGPKLRIIKSGRTARGFCLVMPSIIYVFYST
jgi:hypothetical protein